MNGFPRKSVRFGFAVLGKAVVATALAVACWTSSAQASRIHSAQVHSSISRDLRAWEVFIAGGLTHWETVHAPPIDLSVRKAFFQNLAGSDPTANPWVEYLEWRRDLAPARFDFWHPNIGPILQNLTPPTTTTTTTPTNPITQQLNPPPVPEPSTFAIALALCGGGLWWRRRMASARSTT